MQKEKNKIKMIERRGKNRRREKQRKERKVQKKRRLNEKKEERRKRTHGNQALRNVRGKGIHGNHISQM